MERTSSEALYERSPGAAARELPGGYRGRYVEGTALHQVVRENLSSFLVECAGLPRIVEWDFEQYLDCGVLARGFTRVACTTCRDELLVAFSCKGRGVCPSCNARRAHDAAIHLTERVLPRAPYRQWTLSLPIQLRLLLARDAALLSQTLGVLMRTLFAFQRKTARRLGVGKPVAGAVAFVQRVGSAIQLTPHFHVLLPEAVFEELPGTDSQVRLCPLPPPDDEEVEKLLRTVALRVVALLRKKGQLEDPSSCEDALDFFESAGDPASTAASPGARASSPEEAVRLPGGFSLHANTWVHENNREGLERLCNYGARGPLSLQRLYTLPDGRVAYRMKPVRLRPGGASARWCGPP